MSFGHFLAGLIGYCLGSAVAVVLVFIGYRVNEEKQQ